jgi:hypothetical protein
VPATGGHCQLADQRAIGSLAQRLAIAVPQVQGTGPGQPERPLSLYLPQRCPTEIGPWVEPDVDDGVPVQGADLAQQHQPPFVTRVPQCLP